MDSVSETETHVHLFQTRKRKPAIPLGRMASLLVPRMEIYERWSAQLGVSWEKVLSKADVSDPKEGSRATKSRMAKGGAPRARKKIHAVLSDLEKRRDERTEIGAVLLGLEDWAALGAELANREPRQFMRLLDALRKQVAAADAASAFGDITKIDE